MFARIKNITIIQHEKDYIMSGCPFTHPLDLDAYRSGMPYEALAAARPNRERP